MYEHELFGEWQFNYKNGDYIETEYAIFDNTDNWVTDFLNGYHSVQTPFTEWLEDVIYINWELIPDADRHKGVFYGYAPNDQYKIDIDFDKFIINITFMGDRT